MKRTGAEENKTVLEIVALDKYNNRGAIGQASFKWPTYPVPAPDFEVSRTVIAPGESIIFSDRSSETAQSIKWDFAMGIPLGSTDKNVTVTYGKEGTYDVTLTASNAAGSKTITKKQLITVSSDAVAQIANIARSKPVLASSYVSNSECPDKALDGTVLVNNKWCAVGSAPHWLKIDLGGQYSISEFAVKHAQEGGESAEYNTCDFKIRISEDGKTWSDAVDVKGNKLGLTRHPIAVTKGRYVELYIAKPTQTGDTAARIYDFEVYGYKDDNGNKTGKYNVKSVATVDDKKVPYATSFEKLGLPDMIRVTLDNGYTKNVPVEWNVKAYNPEKVATQNIKGTLLLTDRIKNTGKISLNVKITVESPLLVTGNNSVVWLEEVKIGSLSNKTGAEAVNGYGDYTAKKELITNIIAGKATDVSMTAGYASPYSEKPFALIWRIWVDLNQDGDIHDEGELIYDAKTKSSTTGTMSIPDTALKGKTRMRVCVGYAGGSVSPSGVIDDGEAEDYFIIID